MVFYLIGAKDASSTAIMLYTLLNTGLLLIILDKVDNVEKKIKEKE